MSTVSQTGNSDVSSVIQSSTTTGAKKTNVTGRTIGNPQLSEEGAKYYEQLKKKYGNMDFILVSSDMKQQAQAQAASYGNASKMVVLIDEEKIERMATDEAYRAQYEGIIRNAASGLSQLASGLSNTSGVKGFGAQINDNGTASYFAVVDKSLAAQRERIAKKAEEKRADKKEAEKRAARKANEERRNERIKEGKASKDEDLVTVTASSVEELIRKVNDLVYEGMSDNIRTETERQLGGNFDFKI